MKKITNILFYISDYSPIISGTVYRLANTIEQFKDLNVTAKIMTPQIKANSVYNEGIIPVPHRLPLPFAPYDVVPYAISLPILSSKCFGSILEKEKPDLVHIIVNLPDLGVFTLIKQCKKYNIPFVIGYHTYVIDHLKDLPWVLRTPISSIVKRYYKALKKFVPIIAPSKAVIDMLGLNQEDHVLVWNPAIKPEFFPTSASWDCKRLTFVYTGRITKTKGITQLIDIFKHLKSLGDYQLYLCGPVEDHEYIELIKKHDNMVLQDPVNYAQIHKILHQGSYFITCSETETLGNTLLEAMMSGLVPFCVPMGGSKILVKNNENGIYLDHVDAQKNALLIHQELQNDLKIKMLRKNSIQFASKFSVENSTRELLMHYQQFVDAS